MHNIETNIDITKHLMFMKQIVFRYLPLYKDAPDQALILERLKLYPGSLDVERLVEHALAHVGGYNFIDDEGKDFDDGDESDSKSTSINKKTRKVEISGVENKIGALRITIFNPFTELVDFMFIPHIYLLSLIRDCHGINAHKKRIVMSWTPAKENKPDNYNMYECFRLKSFEDLAQMTTEKFLLKFPNNTLPNPDYFASTRNRPRKQTTNLYTVENDQQQILDGVDTQPSSLFD